MSYYEWENEPLWHQAISSMNMAIPASTCRIEHRSRHVPWLQPKIVKLPRPVDDLHIDWDIFHGFSLASAWLQLGFSFASAWLQLCFSSASAWLQLGFSLASAWLQLGFSLAMQQTSIGRDFVWWTSATTDGQTAFRKRRQLQLLVISSGLFSNATPKDSSIIEGTWDGRFRAGTGISTPLLDYCTVRTTKRILLRRTPLT